MAREQNPNLAILERAVALLGALSGEMVFVGGCATGLLLTDPAASPIRATQDVDVITEIASVGAYHHLSARLRERGFREDQGEDAPICRWLGDGVILDVMPTHAEILGFGNEWYAPALASSREIGLPSGKSISMVTAPCFLATKLAAFEGRGNGDYMMSHDIEDVVAVLDGRAEVVGEVGVAEPSLRRFLARRFAELLNDPRFKEALPGHLPADPASQARLPTLLDRIATIAEMK